VKKKMVRYRVRTKKKNTRESFVTFSTKAEAEKHASSQRRYIKEAGTTGRVTIKKIL
jgi:hypothetical protein